MDERRAKELLGPYLLGELSGEEERELEERLENSGECQRELAELREAHEFLRQPSYSPPPELKERVLSQAGTAGAVGSGTRPAAGENGERAAGDDAGYPARGAPRRHRRGSVRRVGRVVAPLVAAGLIVAAFLLGGMLSGALPTLGGPEETIELSSTELVPESSGEVRVSGSGTNYEVELEVRSLPEPPGDGFYELWFIGEEGRMSAGTFRTSSGGEATVRLSVPSNSRSYERVRVTYEPADGDPMPSGREVLGGSLGGDPLAVRPAAT